MLVLWKTTYPKPVKPRRKLVLSSIVVTKIIHHLVGPNNFQQLIWIKNEKNNIKLHLQIFGMEDLADWNMIFVFYV